MAKIRVEVSPRLVEDYLKTGSSQRRTVISKGLPQDAILVWVELKSKFGEPFVELVFESESEPEDKVGLIAVTTLENV